MRGVDHVPCGQHLNRECGALGKTDRVKERDHLRRGRERVLRIHLAAQRRDALARLKVRDTSADRFDLT